MQQVIINLLSNAIKFSKPGDVIEVKLMLVDLKPQNEVELQIKVSDQGVGISVEEQLNIF